MSTWLLLSIGGPFQKGFRVPLRGFGETPPSNPKTNEMGHSSPQCGLTGLVGSLKQRAATNPMENEAHAAHPTTIRFPRVSLAAGYQTSDDQLTQ